MFVTDKTFIFCECVWNKKQNKAFFFSFGSERMGSAYQKDLCYLVHLTGSIWFLACKSSKSVLNFIQALKMLAVINLF